MTLHQILIISLVLGLTALIFMFISLAIRANYTLKEDEVKKSYSIFYSTNGAMADPNKNPHIISQKEKCRRLETAASVLSYLTLTLLAAALCALTIFCWFRHVAQQHGAYGDVLKTETIATVRDRSKHMFIDHSDNLPEDLSGSILIFFKYTCDDCYDTHGQIMDTLAQEQAENVYFVSSASEKGTELVSQLNVKAVPWGVLVGENNTPVISDILYDEFETEPDNKFIKENLMKLIQAQRGETTE